MNYTDQSARTAEFDLYIKPAGVDLAGNPLYQLQPFCYVKLNDPTDGTPIFAMPLPWMHPLGDPGDASVSFRLEMVSGPIPAPTTSSDLPLHYVGPL